MTASPCFTLRRVSKTYRPAGQLPVPALREVSVVLPWGARVGVLGHSGAGKSTLLHLLGLLDVPDDDGGVILFHDGEPPIDYRTMPDAERDRLKKQRFGFVFQRGHLLHHLTAAENVALKLTLSGLPVTERRQRARELLDHLGLGDRAGRRAHQLSGGEAQRVAVLRALASNPRVVFADEPTGNLDRRNADDVLGLLCDWQQGGSVAEPRTLLLVTHQVQDAWDRCTHFLILRRDAAGPPTFVAKADLEGQGGRDALVGLLTEEVAASVARPPLPPWSAGKVGVLALADYFWLAWGDLTRREHRAATLANGLVLGFLLVLSFLGLALRDGMNRLIDDRLQTLEATTFTIDGLKTRDGYLTDELTAELTKLTLDGRPAFVEVQRFNLSPGRQFRVRTPDGLAGDRADRLVSGRTALPDDPYLRALVPAGFGGPQAREIVVTRQLLTETCQSPPDAGVVWLDVAGQAMPLRVVAVVEEVRGGYAFVLPDGLEQLLRSDRFNPQPVVRGVALGGVGDATALRDKLLADADLAERLVEGRLDVEADAGRLVLRLKDGQVQRQDVMQRLGNTWRRLLGQRGWVVVGRVGVEDLPAPVVELPPATFGKATLRVRHPDDLPAVQEKLAPLGLGVPDDVLAVLALLRNTVRPLGGMIAGLVGLALLVGGCNLAVTMRRLVGDRRVEIGLLKAHGMTTGQLGVLYALEGLLLLAMTTAVAWTAGWLLAGWGNHTAASAGWPALIRYDAAAIGWTALAAVGLAPVVCWLATRWQAAVTPAEAVA